MVRYCRFCMFGDVCTSMRCWLYNGRIGLNLGLCAWLVCLARAFAGAVYLVAGTRLLHRGSFPSVFDKHRTAPYLAVYSESVSGSKRTHEIGRASWRERVCQYV